MNFESTVMYYLAKKGLFLSPQFSISSEDGTDFRCPDFVGLDFLKKEVNIIEVTMAYDIKYLVQKVNDRNNQWISKLKEHLIKNNIVDSSWSYIIRVFIRNDRFEYFERNLKNNDGVILQSLEEIAFPWQWNIWEQENIETVR